MQPALYQAILNQVPQIGGSWSSGGSVGSPLNVGCVVEVFLCETKTSKPLLMCGHWVK